MSTQVTVPVLPNCDMCALSDIEFPAEYDAKTVYGPWANMCRRHWQVFAAFPDLGTGKGQRLVLKEEKDDVRSPDATR